MEDTDTAEVPSVAEACAPLRELVRPEALQSANPHLWPSAASFDWWRREHRDALEAAHAIVEINGRTFLHASRTIDVVMAEGARQAAERRKQVRERAQVERQSKANENAAQAEGADAAAPTVPASGRAA